MKISSILYCLKRTNHQRQAKNIGILLMFGLMPLLKWINAPSSVYYSVYVYCTSIMSNYESLSPQLNQWIANFSISLSLVSVFGVPYFIYFLFCLLIHLRPPLFIVVIWAVLHSPILFCFIPTIRVLLLLLFFKKKMLPFQCIFLSCNDGNHLCVTFLKHPFFYSLDGGQNPT
jgi:hypothetical protein